MGLWHWRRQPCRDRKPMPATAAGRRPLRADAESRREEPCRARKNCVLVRANPHAIAIAPHVTAAGAMTLRRLRLPPQMPAGRLNTL